jgi:hypothetical protein
MTGDPLIVVADDDLSMQRGIHRLTTPLRLAN